MSSKIAPNTMHPKRAGRSSAPWSITSRLTLLYTLSALGLLALSSAFLYWVLVSNLAAEDHQFLVDKIHVLRVIVREYPESPEVLEEEVTWEGTALHYAQYYARVLDARGNTLRETTGMSDLLPVGVFPPPVGAQEEPTEGVRWRSRERRSYLLLGAWTEVGHRSGQQRQLQVALDVSRKDALLANYRRKLAMVLLVGIVLSAGTGVAVAGTGMRPLTHITKAAQRITAARLHERIEPAQWPQELAALALAFDEMLTRLEDAFTRLSQCAADLAHELRTPINNLMGEAEVALSRSRTPDEYRQVLESSLEEYARLSHMIDSLLFLARAEGPTPRLARSSFDARQQIEAVREFYEAVAEEQGVEVRCHGQALVYADALLVQRAVSNLLTNALQYTPSGGRIIMSVTPSADQGVDISVRDTGSGIAPEHLPRVFDRFYRADGARSHYPQGTGLGLAIVQSIMDLHQGTVVIQSAPAIGTTVTLRFPPATPRSKMSTL